MSEQEYHVASYVVQANPADADAIAAQINAMPGLEVHASEAGKLVVTAEAGGARELAELAETMQQLGKVLSVAPVYHEFTSAREAGQPEPGSQN